MTWLGTIELIRRILPWLGLTAIPLAILAGVQTVNANNWQHTAEQNEIGWVQEKVAHRQTIINYQTAAQKARKADAENKARVEAEQARINAEREQSYEARLADARARAERLRQQLEAARTHPGGPGAAPMPRDGNPAGGPDGAPGDPGLSVHERFVATKQAIQLDEIQKWIRGQLGIDPNGK